MKEEREGVNAWMLKSVKQSLGAVKIYIYDTGEQGGKIRKIGKGK